MKKYDWTKAQAVVDEYLSALDNNHPLRIGRSWLEVTMERVGFVDDSRGWKFGESHAAWYACLIITGNIGRVTKKESSLQVNPSKTAMTIRSIRFGKLRNTVTGNFLVQMLEDAAVKKKTAPVPSKFAAQSNHSKPFCASPQYGITT